MFKKFISSFSIGMLLVGTAFPIIASAELFVPPEIEMPADFECTARTACKRGAKVCVDHNGFDEDGNPIVIVRKCEYAPNGQNDCGCVVQ